MIVFDLNKLIVMMWNELFTEWSTYNQLFLKLVGRQKSNCFHVSKIDIISEHVHINDLTHVFLSIIALKEVIKTKTTSRNAMNEYLSLYKRNGWIRTWTSFPSLNVFRILAISLFTRFSSASLLAPVMSYHKLTMITKELSKNDA